MMKQQLLIVDPPNELKFRGPFHTSVTSYIHLTNPTTQKIVFKIKTTAPKKYCVRPNSGILDPKTKVEIAIVLQPFQYDPTEKNKHKFMVQSAIVPLNVDESVCVDQIWKDTNPEELSDTKLRCVFVCTVDNTKTNTASERQNTTALISNEASVPDFIQGSGDEKLRKTLDGSIDIDKTAAEMRQMREAESQLRQENLQLKEQILRLRMTVEANSKEQSAKPSSSSQYVANPYSPPQMANQQIPIIYVIAAVIMAILGLIFGKFVL